MDEDVVSIRKTKLAYNLDEAAEATGYSASTLRIAIRRNDLVARYANTKPILLAEELLDWLRSLPTEPKGGHQPLSHLGDISAGWPGPPTVPQSSDNPARALFRTPEEVAPELGLSKSTLRTYCRISGIHTRMGKNRIMLHEDDVRRLVAWIRQRNEREGSLPAGTEQDPFV